MKVVEMTCINCPLGCKLTVEIADNNEMTVTGNTCAAGVKYARQEATDPRRMVTSIVRVVSSANTYTLSVKTKEPVPKNRIFDVMEALKKVTVSSPVNIGDVIVKNVADTGIDIIATTRIA